MTPGLRAGTCPRCDGTEVYGARNGLREYRESIRPHLEPGFQGVATPHLTTELWDFVCARCGFVESSLIDPAGIDFVRGAWVRIQPPDSAG